LTVCQWFGLKITGTVCQWFVLKTTRTVFLKTGGNGFSQFDFKTSGSGFLFGPQNQQLQFGDLCLKIIVRFFCLSLKTKRTMVYRLRHKTDRGRTARDTHQDLMTLLRLKVSRTRVFQSDQKTVGGATIGGARDIIIEITSRES
jgi:hypothetical protein